MAGAIREMARKQLSYGYIRSMCSAVFDGERLTLRETSTHPLVQAAKTAARRYLAGRPVIRRNPLLGDNVWQILANINWDLKISARDGTMVGVGTALGLRGDDLTGLWTVHVVPLKRVGNTLVPGTWDDYEAARIYINSSKMDQFWKGASVILSSNDPRSPRTALGALRRWILVYAPAHGPLFPSLAGRSKGGEIKTATVAGRLKRALSETGTNPTGFGSHSMRAGMATEAWRAGVDDRLLKQHGRWLSDAVQTYKRPDLLEQASVVKAMDM